MRERIRYEIKIRYTPFNQSAGRRVHGKHLIVLFFPPPLEKNERNQRGCAIKGKDETEMKEATSTVLSKFRRSENVARGGIR